MKIDITKYIGKDRGVWFIIYAVISSFCLYSCAFAFRKAFSVSTYEGLMYWNIDYKVWLITFQVVGYMTSKFLGIKYVSESPPEKRAFTILFMMIIAMLSLFLFAITPPPYNIIFMYFNGLPLGMVWGLVFGYLEGRRSTEILGAGVSASFIFGSGLAKSIGKFVIVNWGVDEFWMPFVVALLFMAPLCVFLFMLNLLPPPDELDEKERTKRIPMNKKSRKDFFVSLSHGLILLIIAYMLLTAFREFRDNFMAEIWKELGENDTSLFAYTETIIAIGTLIICGSVMFIKNNKNAMIINHLIVIFGIFLVGISNVAFEYGVINSFWWMTLIGMGLYMGYVPFNSIFFERIIAAFRYVSNVGFLIYLADAFGYLASVNVLFYKQFGQRNTSWLHFFISSGYVLSFIGSILMVASLIYFLKKLSWVEQQNTYLKVDSKK
ncbi:MAG: DUF5690 family protein [Chitinophagaceae bacterium]|nr:DUF5690 family protein [Chitinophagaceae bacterium]